MVSIVAHELSEAVTDPDLNAWFDSSGDENADIFDGLAITAHAGPAVFHNYADRPHYVAAEQVASIDPGRVTLSISAQEAAHLPLHDVPESAQIEPEDASRLERAETWFEHKAGEDRTE